MSLKLNILSIEEGTSVDGPGLRTSIYLAGCRHQCQGCHNPKSWNFDEGISMTLEELVDIVAYNDFNVTLSGGDPFYHSREVLELCQIIKERLDKNVWCYTGFTWEEIISSSVLSTLLKCIDVVVDGRYIESLRDASLHFRGSSNQRIIDVKRSLMLGKPVELSF